jgi:Zn-dependent proteases
MFKSSYHICTVSGIPIRVEISLLVMLFLVVSRFTNPVFGIAVGIGLAISIALHELGHSLVAQAFGCKVRDITLMMLGGCATIVNMPRKAWQEILMAAAGPAVSALLAAFGIAVGSGLIPVPGRFFGAVVVELAWWNLGLLLFNLLPAFPLDGGRILRAFLQQFFMTRVRATWVASRLGRFFAILLVASVVWSFLSGNFKDYMFIRLLIAYMIYQSAEQEYRMVLMEEGGARRKPNPFAGFPFFGRSSTRTPPPDDGKAVVSPPPYERGGATRVDVHKEN